MHLLLVANIVSTASESLELSFGLVLTLAMDIISAAVETRFMRLGGQCSRWLCLSRVRLVVSARPLDTSSAKTTGSGRVTLETKLERGWSKWKYFMEWTITWCFHGMSCFGHVMAVSFLIICLLPWSMTQTEVLRLHDSRVEYVWRPCLLRECLFARFFEGSIVRNRQAGLLTLAVQCSYANQHEVVQSTCQFVGLVRPSGWIFLAGRNTCLWRPAGTSHVSLKAPEPLHVAEAGQLVPRARLPRSEPTEAGSPSTTRPRWGTSKRFATSTGITHTASWQEKGGLAKGLVVVWRLL